MTLLIVKNAQSNEIAVFDATEEQVEQFNTSDDLPIAIMGWPVYTPDDLAETCLYDSDLVDLYKEANPTAQEIPGEPTKRQLANIVFWLRISSCPTLQTFRHDQSLPTR